jgi:hypothetical protein
MTSSGAAEIRLDLDLEVSPSADDRLCIALKIVLETACAPNKLELNDTNVHAATFATVACFFNALSSLLSH